MGCDTLSIVNLDRIYRQQSRLVLHSGQATEECILPAKDRIFLGYQHCRLFPFGIFHHHCQ